MFNFLDALQGTTQTADEEGEEETQEVASSEESGATSSTPLGLSSFWSVATAVTAVVKQTAGDVVRSVQETDWKSELQAFTHEVQTEATVVAEAVTHIPEHLQHAAEAAPAAGSPRAAAAGALGVLGTLGASLLEKTQGVLEQVTDLVEHELETAATEVERMTAGKPARSERLVARQQAQAKYSRFEAEVAAIQRDSSTYCDEPADAEEFAAWRQRFDLAAAKPDVERITSGNAFMSELQARIVPILVEYEDFWLRYFYKLHKLQQREEQRQQLAARAKMQEEQEELGWEDEDADSTAPVSAAAGPSSGVALAAAAASVGAGERARDASSSGGGGAASREGIKEDASRASGDVGCIHQPGDSHASTGAPDQEQPAGLLGAASTQDAAAPSPEAADGLPSSSEPVAAGEQPPAADSEQAAAAVAEQEAGVLRPSTSAQPAAAEAMDTPQPLSGSQEADPGTAAAAAAAAAAAPGSRPSSDPGGGAGGTPSSPEAHTESDGSTGQREWCVVTSPRATAGDIKQSSGGGAACVTRESTAGKEEAPKVQSAPAKAAAAAPTTAAASAVKPPAAAAAAAAAGEEDDEDWGCTDDAGGPAPAAAPGSAQGAGTPGQDDWDEWD